jgi:hypothetical protein
MGCQSCNKLREEEKRMDKMMNENKKNSDVKNEDKKVEHTHLWEMVNGRKVKRVNYE